MNFVKITLTAALIGSLVLNACKDKEEDPAPGSTDKCAGKTLSLTADVLASTKCSNTGQLTLRARGSSGFVYSLNGAAFQSDSVFAQLSAGAYTLTAKDADGCIASANVVVGETGTAGSGFTAVSAIIASKCNQACHTTGAGGAPKGIFATPCDIVNRKAMIKLKSVDGTMGALNSTEKSTITAWINAGGSYTD